MGSNLNQCIHFSGVIFIKSQGLHIQTCCVCVLEEGASLQSRAGRVLPPRTAGRRPGTGPPHQPGDGAAAPPVVLKAGFRRNEREALCQLDWPLGWGRARSHPSARLGAPRTAPAACAADGPAQGRTVCPDTARCAGASPAGSDAASHPSSSFK